MSAPTSKVSTVATLLLLLGAIPACVSTTDIDRLRSQVHYQEQERQKQDQRIAQLEADQSQSRPAQANSWAEVNSMRSQVAALNGQMDDLRRKQDTQHANGVTLESVNAKVQELDRKTTAMAAQLGVVFEEGPAAPSAAGGQTVTPPPAVSATPAAIAPAAAAAAGATATKAAPAVKQDADGEPMPAGGDAVGQDLYQKALENFYAKKYKQAQTMWGEFVNGYPKDPLVPNALFWEGESFFQLQDFANAVLTYQKVIEKYPNSNKYKSAMLKQGICFYKLKKEQAGKLVLEDLVKKYPDSPEAKRAQAYMKGGN